MVIIQYDIFGNIIPQKLCKCGCGEPVFDGNDYIRGHYMSSKEGQKEQSKRLTQYNIDNPEAREENKERQIQFHIDHPEARKEVSMRTTQYFIDHPEAREEVSKKGRQYFIDHPEELEENSKRQIQYYIDNPEFAEEQSKRLLQFHIDHPEFSVEQSKRQTQYFINNPEARERASAISQGQDYDAGEWTGFTDNTRPYVIPVNRCCHINTHFPYSHAHHITPSIIIFIPKELHKHIYHNIKTGQGMAEMNMLALQFINGCYDYVKF